MAEDHKEEVILKYSCGVEQMQKLKEKLTHNSH